MLIRDSRQLADWPTRTIIHVEAIQPPPQVRTEFAQLITLECGHRLVNCYNRVNPNPSDGPVEGEGAAMRCRSCAMGLSA